MSEYQYYEFQTVDQPLSEKQLRELRAYSTRATITSTRFVNSYNWGGLKADPRKWMEKHFDAFVYVANWGTRELMFRFPLRWVDRHLIEQFCVGEFATTWIKNDAIVIRLTSQNEEGDSWDDDGSDWLSSLIPLRDDIARGDHRALYLAWLASVQNGELSESDLEPFLPSGLNELTPSLKALIEFLRLDEDLVEAASTSSPKLKELETEFENWIETLPEKETNKWLLRFTSDQASRIRFDLIKHYQDSNPKKEGQKTSFRDVQALMTLSSTVRQRRHREKEAELEREKLRHQRERNMYLNQLSKRKLSSWQKIESLLQTKKQSDYDAAVQLLKDLRDVAKRDDHIDEITEKIQELRKKYRTRSAFHRRLTLAGL
jgi:hypothetical protein